jgi:DNA polymerase I-like protein with 3'-5' exonuclease and polymerase domains
MPLVRVLAAMEAAGVLVDVEVLEAQMEPLQKRIRQLQRLVDGFIT